MLIADIKELPKLGEKVVMANSVHGEIESLITVMILPDDEIDQVLHVFFASEDPVDNINVENGIYYYSIRTYMPVEE